MAAKVADSFRPLIIAGFAAHRAARAISVDTITEPLRERALNFLVQPVMRRNGSVNHRATSRHFLAAQLIECPHCVGFHLSYLFLGAYLMASRRRWGWLKVVVEVWAVAGIQSSLASLQAAAETAGHIDPDVVNEASEVGDED